MVLRNASLEEEEYRRKDRENREKKLWNTCLRSLLTE
jgi:hypothetical protein